MDQNRCISCSRCIGACAEVEGAIQLGYDEQGYQIRVISDFNTLWGESTTCTSCGKCVQACPTGALWAKSIVQGQQDKHPEFITDLMERENEPLLIETNKICFNKAIIRMKKKMDSFSQNDYKQ